MSEHKLYDGTVTLQFSAQARNRYLVGDFSPVGVTSILSAVLAKPALMLWPLNEAMGYIKANSNKVGAEYILNETLLEKASKAYTVKSDAGKDMGTQIHAEVEKYLNNPGVPVDFEKDNEVARGFRAFQKWYLTQNIRPLAVERVIYSKEHRFAGTFDCLLEIDGHVVLADIKTNNASRTAPLGIYAEHFLQLGAYSLAHHEEFPLEQIEDLLVIRVGKDGIVNTLSASKLNLGVHECEDLFLNVLRLYRYMTPVSKKLKKMK